MLQHRVDELTSELDEVTSHKMSLDKRIENLKASSKASREEATELQIEVETMKGRIADLQNDLSIALKSSNGSAEASSTEIKVLEEENIELMGEIKDLRRELTVYRLQADRAQQQLAQLHADTAHISSASVSGNLSVVKERRRSGRLSHTPPKPLDDEMAKKENQNNVNVLFVESVDKSVEKSSKKRNINDDVDKKIALSAVCPTSSTTTANDSSSALAAGMFKYRQ